MRRIAVLVTVAALIAVMMAMTIAPAFAAPSVYRCTDGNGYYLVYKKDVKEIQASGDTCVDTSTL